MSIMTEGLSARPVAGSLTGASEEELVQRTQAGDERALDELASSYSTRLRPMGR